MSRFGLAAPAWVTRALAAPLRITKLFFLWLILVRCITILEYEFDSDVFYLMLRSAVIAGLLVWIFTKGASRLFTSCKSTEVANVLQLAGLSLTLSVAYWLAETTEAQGMADTFSILWISTTMLTYMLFFLYSQVARVGAAYENIRTEEGALEAQLSEMAEQSSHQIAKIVSEAQAEAVAAFDKQISAVRRRGDHPFPADVAEINDRIKTESLRPLSQRLLNEIPDWKSSTIAVERRPLSLPAKFSVAEALRPQIFVWLAPLFVVSQLAVNGIQILPYVLFYVSVHAVLWFAIRRFLRGLELPTLFGVIVLTFLSIGVPVVATYAEVQLANQLYVRLDLYSQILQNTQVMPLLVLGVAYVVKISKAVRLTLEHLGELSEQLATSKRAFAVRAFAVQKQFAVFLHGIVQSALSAAALRLQAGNFTDAAWVQYFVQLKEAERLLEDFQPVQVDLESQLNLLTQLWKGIATVEVKISTGLMQQIMSDTYLAYCVNEVIQEAVSNAVRHGAATQVFCKVSRVEHSVSLAIANDGCQPLPKSHSGLGFRILDDLCSEWWFESDPGSELPVVLKARIPFSDTLSPSTQR